MTPTAPAGSISITWTAANTFTTTDLTHWGAASVGDEVFVVSGGGSGKTAHISTITADATKYTVVLDESLFPTSGTATAIVDNFKKLQSITNATAEKEIGEVRLGEKTPWVKIKVEMRGYDINIPLLDIISKPDKQNA